MALFTGKMYFGIRMFMKYFVIHQVKKENENKDQKESTMDVIEIIDTDEEQEEIDDDDDDDEDRTIGEEDDEDDDDDDDNISLAESSMREYPFYL